MRLFQNAAFPFIDWRTRGFIISGVALLIGIGAMVVNVATTGSWLNYGVDFTGGTLVQVEFHRPTTVEEIRQVETDWQITRFGEENEFIIRMPSFSDELDEDPSLLVSTSLEEHFGEGAASIVRVEAVGPTVGAELQQKAALAILVSVVLTLIYIAFRFEWRFGLASVVATLHDVIITLGFLALINSEISVGTVAAFLTIVGYSLNDTIVVFDRIREILAKRTRGTTFEKVLDQGINETLPRTVLTSATTLATLLALYLFGGAVIRDFAMILILGVVIGTYSSIFVASPVLYLIEKRWPRREASRRRSSAPKSREGAVV